MASLAPVAAAVPDPVESCVAAIVDAYREWRKKQTVSPGLFKLRGQRWDHVFDNGATNELTIRLAKLGFQFTTRLDAKHEARLDIWKLPIDHVDPASELGRMLGLPMPEPNPQADKVLAVVRDINDQFSTWLLTNDYVPGVNSPVFSMQVDELSDPSRALLRRMMAAHGWHVGDLAALGGSSDKYAFRRRVHAPCS